MAKHTPIPAFSTEILKEIILFAFAHGYRLPEERNENSDISERPTLIPGTVEGE